jgi:pyruvate dehydrogenase E2 component (dihydrolipoamide acetyltransferase)
MATDVIMPALGMAQEKGTLLKWLKVEGEAVRKGEPLMEVETDKATVEIEAPASGILAEVTAAPGDEVPVGQRIAVILAQGESFPTALHHPPLPQGEGSGEGHPAAPPTSRAAPPAKPVAQAPTGKVAASPAARRIAREKGVDLSVLKGSGPEGSIVAEDVLSAAGGESETPQGQPRVKETISLSSMRRILGARMTESKQKAPHFYLAMDVDMTEVDKRRAEWKEKRDEIIPSINDFILWACGRALRDFPSLNSALTDQGVQFFSDINIGMAVALEEGLVAPVIRNADRLSLQQLAKQSRELAGKAQKKKLLPLDYEGGTFTVSNLGMFGVDSFVAIINPPQCAILAVGQLAPRVVAHDQSIAVRPTMTMTLSADHRIVDGVIAARFLQEVKRLLENKH